MFRILRLTVLSCLFAWSAEAANEELIGEIFAYADVCPMVRVDDVGLDRLISKIGADRSIVNGDTEASIPMRASQLAARAVMKRRMVSDVCDEALSRFGREGVVARGALVPK